MWRAMHKIFFFSSRRRHTRFDCDWSSDVCSSDLGVVLDHGVTIGPACEVKRSIVMASSNVAHQSFVGDSLIGSDVNIEAGVVVANHFNELLEQEVRVYVGGQGVRTGVTKVGALIGDHSRVGANAVLTPGTVLPPHSVVAQIGR